ncbi:MAG: methyltransferase domain-containing protein, partial [Actinomycetota bacterium]|nr:methyltransferase domain-containing protein [Actinomycetota bacterium]
MTEDVGVREQVRRRYAQAATVVATGQAAVIVETDAAGCSSAAAGECCGPGRPELEQDGSFGAGLYAGEDTAGLPADALLASLGCGNPTAVADLRAGEIVLDLGSGGGIDVLLSARRVGPSGHAYGLDMTDEMLELARTNAAEAGATNVEFIKGEIEAIPL